MGSAHKIKKELWQGWNMSIASMIFAILAGIFTTVETSINAQLGKHITPSLATLHSLIVGTILMIFLCAYGGTLSGYSRVMSVNPLLWLGGIFGALIIYFSSRAIPSLGISNTLILILSGQLISGLVIDVYQNNIELSSKKVMGLIMFLIGTIMFLRE
jgi:transporter family-2 protein